jgi:hypothetical protein
MRRCNIAPLPLADEIGDEGLIWWAKGGATRDRWLQSATPHRSEFG